MADGATEENKSIMGELPPLPDLTSEQWFALPKSERARIRALKKLHDAAAAGAPGKRDRGSRVCPPAQEPNPAETPFRSREGKPTYLNTLGAGASCFIVLSGPSINELDLSKLRRRGIFTIAVNNAACLVRPNAWIYVDTPNKFHESIWMDPAVLKFVHWRHLNDKWLLRHKIPDYVAPAGQVIEHKEAKEAHSHGFECLQRRDPASGKLVAASIADMPGVIGIVRNANFQADHWLSEPTINWGNSKNGSKENGRLRCLNVMFAVLKLAFALGFRSAYLLGCDFSMSSERPYAFKQEKHDGGCESNDNCYRTMNVMFGELLPHFEASGYQIRNCNLKSGLTVFPGCSYDEAIEAATGHIPQDPLDTREWYYK